MRRSSALPATPIAPPTISTALPWTRTELLDGSQGLRMALQPVVDLRRGTVVGYEALARFPGTRSPDQWFVAAQDLGCGPELELRAMNAALARRADLPADCFLAVNISPAALLEPAVAAALHDAAPLAGIVLELTERNSLHDSARLVEELAALRALGAHIAIDDLGAGYAGLQWMHRLRPDMIKIDRAFVSGVDRDEGKRALVDMVGVLANRLDAWVLAEGIEEYGELDTITRLGIPLGQGFLLGRAEYEPTQPTAAIMDRLQALVRTGVPDQACTLHVIVEAAAPGALVPINGRSTAGMVVREYDNVQDVASRVLTRAPSERWEPLVCVDRQGRYVGIVRVERIIETLVRMNGAQDS